MLNCYRCFVSSKETKRTVLFSSIDHNEKIDNKTWHTTTEICCCDIAWITLMFLRVSLL